MDRLQLLSSTEQVAARLRAELMAGNLRGEMPGVLKLEAELEVNRNTVEAALRLLEAEGLLQATGKGRRRKIVGPSRSMPLRKRIAILGYEPQLERMGYMVDLQHLLEKAGNAAFFTGKTLVELRMDLSRIRRLVQQTEADAWIIPGGSREVLEWFAARETPAFALFGRRRGLPIPGVGPDKPPAIAAATRALIQLGHRRIVLLARAARRLPEPGESEQTFLNELAAHGILAGSYHLPDWEESIRGFQERLISLFQLTPPTALIIQESVFYVAALQFCANRGLRVPQDVSLICTDADPTFAWCQPSVAHIRWDTEPVVRRIVRWAANVSRGKEDLRQTLTPAEFVPGGTIGPADNHWFSKE
jgi:DNA-binding LacI/PurR family transcriptional regulator